MTLKSCNIFGIQHKNVWSTLSPSPHLEQGLTEPNEKQHYLIVSKADYLWLQNPHFRQCNTLLRCIRATTLFHATKDCGKRRSVNLFPDANPLEEGGIRRFCFGELICSNTDCLHPSPSLHALSAICRWVTRVFMCTSLSVCERVCQRFHTATDCYLVIHTVSGDEWVKRIVTRVWMCVCMWVGVRAVMRDTQDAQWYLGHARSLPRLPSGLLWNLLFTSSSFILIYSVSPLVYPAPTFPVLLQEIEDLLFSLQKVAVSFEPLLSIIKDFSAKWNKT